MNWTVNEEKLLVENYANKSEKELLLLFPDRTWGALTIKAFRLNLKRQRWRTLEEAMAKYLNKNSGIFGENESYPTECWIWTGPISGSGYGKVTLGNIQYTAHRIIYETIIGKIPKELELDHLCRVRPCCRPLHLEPVTGRENKLRGISPAAINARKTRCINGHKLNAGNVWIGGNGWRYCRKCLKVKLKKYQDTLKIKRGKK